MKLYGVADVRQLGIAEELAFEQRRAGDIAQRDVVGLAVEMDVSGNLADSNVALVGSRVDVPFDVTYLDVAMRGAYLHICSALRDVDVAVRRRDLDGSFRGSPYLEIGDNTRSHNKPDLGMRCMFAGIDTENVSVHCHGWLLLVVELASSIL